MSVMTSPTLRQAKSLWSYNPIPNGCVLYLPLWSLGLNGVNFISPDPYRNACVVTGAVQNADGRLFDGSDDHIKCGTKANLAITTGDFSMVILARLNTTGSHVVCFGGSSLDAPAFYSRNNELCLLSKPSTANAPQATTAWTQDLWMMRGVTFDNSEATNNLIYYLNGAAENTVSFDQDFADYTNCIGATNNGATGKWLGDVKEAWLYDRILSAEEMAYIYRNSYGRLTL